MPEKTYEGAFLGVDYSGDEVEYRTKRILEQAMKEMKVKKLEVEPKVLYDIYSLFYSPALVMKPEQDVPDKDYYKMMEAVVGSESLKALRKYTQLNPTESEWAAAQFLIDILKQMQQQQQKQQGQQGQQGEEGEEEQEGDMQGEPQEGDGKEKKSDYKEDDMKGNLEEALKKLLEKMLKKQQEGDGKEAEKKAKAKAQQKKQQGVKTLQGGKDGHEGLLRHNEQDRILEFAKKINVAEVLKRVKADLDTNNNKGTKYKEHKPGEQMDYELGNDVDRIVSSEAALPKELLLLNIIENKLLIRKEGLKSDVGSLYVLIDRSGSMESSVVGKRRIVAAEAIATKLYQNAKKEGRDYYLRFFDTEPYELVHAPKSQAGTELLINYMTQVDQGGGTSIGTALQKALNDLKELDHKNFKYIILITDGEDSVEYQKAAIKAKMEEGNIKLITIMLGERDNKTLAELSDAYLRLKTDKNGTYILYKPEKLKDNGYEQGYAWHGPGMGMAMAMAYQQRSKSKSRG